MAEPARKVVRFAQTAIEARRMWIAPRPADLMATHAEGLPRAAVAACPWVFEEPGGPDQPGGCGFPRTGFWPEIPNRVWQSTQKSSL